MLLAAEHLSINFGTRQLLSDVNFYLEEGKKAIGVQCTHSFACVVCAHAQADQPEPQHIQAFLQAVQ